ncbi:MAG: hypothetical protein ABSG51_13745 [Terracidiphilus sp.]
MLKAIGISLTAFGGVPTPKAHLPHNKDLLEGKGLTLIPEKPISDSAAQLDLIENWAIFNLLDKTHKPWLALQRVSPIPFQPFTSSYVDFRVSIGRRSCLQLLRSPQGADSQYRWFICARPLKSQLMENMDAGLKRRWQTGFEYERIAGADYAQ